MSLFTKSRKYKWTPDWTYEVRGIFWRLKFSEHGQILCEVRDPEKKTAWFNAVNEETGQALWENLTLDEPWWIGVEDIAESRAYLHKFRKPDMPLHSGIICVDLNSGKVLWENADMTFLFADGKQVYTSTQGFESRKYFLLDENTGNVLREYGIEAEEVNSLRAAQNEEYQFRNYSYPSHFDESHLSYQKHKALVAKHVVFEQVVGNLDVLESAGMLLISWHKRTDKHKIGSPELAQMFLAIEIESNSVLYADTINESVQADAIDSFFVKEKRLYYIKERSILTSFVMPVD